MRQFKIPGGTAPHTTGFSASEKKRLAFMVIGFLFVAVAFATALIKSKSYEDPGRDEIGRDADELVEKVALPDLDPREIDALTSDSTAEDRVLLESEAVDAALEVVRLLTPRHLAALDPTLLDAEVAAGVMADPSAHRMQAYTMRGWLDSIRTRRRGPTKDPEHIGRLILEDESVAYFLVLERPENLIETDFLRIDGVFLKVFSDESSSEPGKWIDGPLIVGPRAVRSYANFGEVRALEQLRLYAVEDDVLLPTDGSPMRRTGLPFETLWHMMAYARDLDPDFDWSEAPELDRDTLLAIMRDGDAYRGQPFRVPISRLQGVRVRKAEENPARIEHYTEGWIGNNTWKNVVFFRAPFEKHELDYPDYVSGTGFFLKNYIYESKDMGLRVAPAFVLQSLEEFHPPRDPTLVYFGYAMAGTTIFLIALFTVLLVRDRRRSKALQEDLVRRKRARRQRRESGGSHSMGTV